MPAPGPRRLILVTAPGDKRTSALAAAIARAQARLEAHGRCALTDKIGEAAGGPTKPIDRAADAHPPWRSGGAVAIANLPEPVWISWPEALANPTAVGAAGQPGDVLRIDSPGSDGETWHVLAARGGFTGDVPAGEWRPGRAWFAGLRAALTELHAGAGHLELTHPHILALTDKLRCQAILEAAGVPVPPAIAAPPTVPALRDAVEDLGWYAVFVKPRWGSSGAGVLGWRRGGMRGGDRGGPGGGGARPEQVVTTAAFAGGRVRNDKHLHTYVDRDSIDALLARVVADGAVLQRWIPKAGTDAGPFDLRVVVIDGRIAQRIGRVGRGPITNLHLDSARAAVADLLPPAVAERVNTVCRAAAAAFPGHRCLGIDVMVGLDGQPFVLECNAWGDHLPGLLLDGQDTYDLQLRGIYP